MAQANVKLTVDASQATRALRGVNNQTKNLQSSFGFLKSAVAGGWINSFSKTGGKYIS